MWMKIRRLAVLPAVAVLAFSLSGCITVQLPSAPEPSRAPIDPAPSATMTPTDDRDLVGDCASGVVVLDQAGADYTLGDCASVTIQGTDIDLDAGEIAQLTVRGDRNDVDAANISSVVIQGQDNDLDSRDIDDLQIGGDRNDVDADGSIALVTVEGNDNEVEATTIDVINDNGRNNIRVR